MVRSHLSSLRGSLGSLEMTAPPSCLYRFPKEVLQLSPSFRWELEGCGTHGSEWLSDMRPGHLPERVPSWRHLFVQPIFPGQTWTHFCLLQASPALTFQRLLTLVQPAYSLVQMECHAEQLVEPNPCSLCLNVIVAHGVCLQW